MKKGCGLLIAIVILLSGCAGNDSMDNAGTGTGTENEETDTEGEEISTSSETPVSEKRYAEKWYRSYNIINYNESIYAFDIPDRISREIVVSGYNELFPSDLQDVLLYLNDDIPDEDKDNAWREYKADCECETISLEIEYYGSYENEPALAVDIDADGEKEYIFSVDDGGTAHYIRTIVAKSIDGEWLAIGGLTSGNSSVRALLEYENQYYLLMGDNLTFWNNEAETPDWKESLIPGEENCWNLLSIEKNVTGYTPIQVYGNPENETIDDLENVDFENLYDYAAENTDFISWDFLTSDFWEAENHSFRFQLSYAWAEMKGEEEYRYIVSEITGGTNYQNDLLLTVCRCTAAGETEVVALYYLCADYEVEFSLYEHTISHAELVLDIRSALV